MPSHKKNHHNSRSSTLTLNGDAHNGAAAEKLLHTLYDDASAAENSLTIETLTRDASNGRETPILTGKPSSGRETLNLSRTGSNGASAENSGYGETLIPTGDAGHGNSETVIPAGDAGHVSFRHGHGADAEGTHCNGRNGCHHHRHHELSAQEKIDNLKQLNQTLLKQVSSSRSAQAELDVKIKALEDELEENNAREDALLMEKNWLENQKLQFELELVSSRKETAELGLEKAGLIAEKQALLASKQGWERDFSESEGKLKETSEKLEESIRVLAFAEEKAQSLNSELERARSDEHRLKGEISTLQMLNSDMQGDMKDLQLKKNSLDDELSILHDDCAAAERQVSEANQVIEALQAELSSRSLEREGFQMQLKEAWQQIASLEAQQEGRIAKEIDLRTRIKHLEDELVRLRNELENTSCTFNQEREARLSLKSLLDSTEGKSRGLKADLHTMGSSMAKLQTDTNGYQQRLRLLQAQVSSVANEKAMLEKTNVSLEEKLRQLNLRSAKVSLEAQVEIEKLKAISSDLEQDLAVAKAGASGGDKIVCQLKSDLKELLRLKKKSKLMMEVSLPLAVVSTSSLVVLGILVFCRRFK